MREFICECSSAGCQETFELTYDAYCAARGRADCFLVRPGHVNAEHDRVLERHAQYWVVASRHDGRS